MLPQIYEQSSNILWSSYYAGADSLLVYLPIISLFKIPHCHNSAVSSDISVVQCVPAPSGNRSSRDLSGGLNQYVERIKMLRLLLYSAICGPDCCLLIAFGL